MIEQSKRRRAGRAAAALAALALALLAPSAAHGQTLFVDAQAAGPGDGAAWERAFVRLADALDAAKDGDEIWVAAGVYYPSDSADREASFALKPGVALYGGFASGESRLDQRDWENNPTVLSGDIGRRGDDSDNAYHVVRGADGAVLDGFRISGGNSLGAGPAGRGGAPGAGAAIGRRPMGPSGGGIHTTPDRVMQGGGAGAGGGMLNFQCAPTVRHCVFENNQAAKGGAVYNMTGDGFPPRPGQAPKTPVFIDCRFENNFAQGRGGGVSNDLNTSPLFSGCVFEGNQTAQKGGGMYNDFGCSPTLINCLFRGNRASSAGAMGNDGGSSPIVYYCTFTENQAADCGPSLYQGTGPANNPAILHSIVWGNLCEWESPGLYNWHDCSPRVEESTIEDAPGAAHAHPRLDERGVSPLDRGYKPGDPRFDPERLDDLARTLQAYRPMAAGRFGPPEPQGAAADSVRISERVVYVHAAAGAGGGGSWAGAHASLSAAIEDAARDGAEIWIAAGEYRPQGEGRQAAFALFPGARLFGGFAGTESSRDERDPRRHATVLSGDIGAPGVASDNCYHVLLGAEGATLDGLVIRDGFADGAGYDGKGGGLIAYRRGVQSRPNAPEAAGFAMTIADCVFTGNFARDGAAAYSYDRARLSFVRCRFEGNRAENGGAVLDRVGVEAAYEDCQFIGNEARWRGGAAYFDYGSRPRLERCVFRGNRTGGHGGAVYSASRASQLENTVLDLNSCRFEENRAAGDGGALSIHDASLATAEFCSFRSNAAGRNGGAIAVTARSSLESQSCDFAENKAAGAGSDIYEEEREPAAAPQASVAEDGDEFFAIILGSGSPQYDPDRAGPSALIQCNDARFLVDMGDRSLDRLYQAGLSPRAIQAALFTHFHLDHSADFIPAFIQGRLGGGVERVVGPPRAAGYVNFILDFYAEDMAYRAGLTGRDPARLREVQTTEIQGSETLELFGVSIRTARVEHSIHTIAYRFDFGGRSIVVSGDLTYSPSLIELARGADAMIMDSGGVIMKGGAARPGGPAGPAMRGPRAGADRRPGEAHASLDQTAAMAAGAAVRRLVLTHLRSGEIDEEATRMAIASQYAGEILFAQDLMRVDAR